MAGVGLIDGDVEEQISGMLPPLAPASRRSHGTVSGARAGMVRLLFGMELLFRHDGEEEEALPAGREAAGVHWDVQW